MEMIGGLIGIIIGLAIFVFWLWALIDIVKSDFRDSATKVIWFIIVFFLYLLGAAIYYFFGRRTKV
jgi:sterol desaturase/sphingolipid hydroxylase (fatty acid hydroxylase superfamily)